MPKYMLTANYTEDGLEALMETGASARRGQLEAMITAAGGTLECIYWTFGADDVFGIADMPDDETAAAAALALANSGAVDVETTVLLTAEQIDVAVKKAAGMRTPGS